MTKLKTASELASERIIVSHYVSRTREDDYIDYSNKEQLKDIEAPIEFVEDWKRPYEKETDDVKMVPCNNEDFIEEAKNEQKRKENIVIKESGIKMQEPEIIHINEKIPEVHWYGQFASYTGFGRSNRAIVFGLSNKGVNVKLDMEESQISVNESTMKELRRMSNNIISPSAPKVYHAIMPLSSSHFGRKIIFTMIENSDTLHKDYVERLNLFDEVWVPTEYGRKLFKKNGVLVPIYVMPLGVDVERYSHDVKPFDFGEQLNSFVFLSVFRWTYRKGYDILLKSYMEEFSSNDNVSLVLVTRRIEDQDSKQIIEDFNGIRSTITKKDDELPHIVLYDKPIHEKYMPGIYTASNAFVLVSRGEGQGLPYLEASSAGLPIIGTNCSGQSDFLKNENSFLIEPDGYIEAKVSGNLSKIAKICHFYENQKFPDFSETGVEQTKKLMRYVYENYDDTSDKTKRLQALVRKNYSWTASIDRIYNRITELQER